jgi:RHS repeat-associated protein
MALTGGYPPCQVMSEHVPPGRSPPETPAFPPGALLDPLPTPPSTEIMRARLIMRGLPFSMLAAVLVFSAPAAGQEDPPCIQCPVEEPNMPPDVTVAPGTGTFEDRFVALTVYWSDDRRLNASSRRIHLNGGPDLAPLFSYEVTHQSPELYTLAAKSEGSVGLQQGSNTISATICDYDQECTTRTVTLVYAAPPVPPPAQIFAVSVTPELTTAMVSANSTTNYTFTVTNDGDGPAVYLPDVVCTGPIASCSRSPESLSLATGQSATVTVSITSTTGTNVIRARVSAQSQAHPTVRAEGMVEAEILIGGQRAPIVTTANVNPGTTLDRSGCLRANVGGGASYECGDVRIVHGLPVTRTMNQARGPVLTYNSQHADPLPTLHANVRVRAGSVVPQSVHARLYINDGMVAEGEWPGTNWTAGATRRLTLLWDARADSTGVYTYRLEVWNRFPTQDLAAVAQTGELVVVNRRTSAFGPGWWLAGLEALHPGQPGGRILWVGGDGSTRLYAPTDGGKFVAPNHATADTIHQITHVVGAAYERRLRDRTAIRYAADGKHHSTINRLGHQTGFHWTSGRLSAIGLPVPVGAPVMGYHFDYDGNGVLNRVTAPPLETRTRETILTRNPSTRDLTIIDPDSQSVRYTHYDGWWFISSQTDRRQTRTEYHWNYYRLARTWRYMSGGATAGPDDIVTYFTPAEFLGLPGTAAVDTADAYTLISGPRFDVAQQTFIWVDRWGAPRRIRDALGNRTHIFREYGPYPALVTRVVAPNGYTRTATYDTRARLTRTVGVNSLGDGRNDTTSYVYAGGDCAYFARRVTAPEKNETHIGYDTACRRIWEQVGSDAARRVNYYYSALGQIDSVRMPSPGGREPARPVERYGYDARGNLTSVQTAYGGAQYHSDAVGRDTLIVTPAASWLDANGRRERVVYDVMDRVLQSTTSARRLDPARHGRSYRQEVESESITVTNQYNLDGTLKSVTRQMSPDLAELGEMVSSTFYDAAGRVTRTVSPGSGADSTTYVGNGRELRYRPRGCDMAACEIVTYFDVLGRDSIRIVPERSSFPPSGPPRTLAADTFHYGYDAAGNLTRADNRDALIRRRYYPGGLLRTDSTWIRDYAGPSFVHAYGLLMQYDRNGRRTVLRYPAGTGPGAAPLAQYTYEPATGALQSIVDVGGNAFDFTYDAQGNPRTITMPGNLVDTRSYDMESRLIERLVPGYRQGTYAYTPSGLLRSFTSVYGSEFEGEYTGLGAAVRTQGLTHEVQAPPIPQIHPADVSVDPLGNVVYAPSYNRGTEIIVRPIETWTTYDAAGAVNYTLTGDTIETGSELALNKEFRVSETVSFTPDGSGNVANSLRWSVREWSHMDPTQPRRTVEERSSQYYGWDGLLRVVDQTKLYCIEAFGCDSFEFGEDLLNEPVAVFEEYRYDALGRRIMVRSRPDPRCTLASCYEYIDRYVWDGSQILHEWRSTHGGVTYTHGGGIDVPVSLWSSRLTATVVLHANRQGLIDMGTYTNGTRVSADEYFWAGLQTPRYPQYHVQPKGLGWLGSLVSNKQDGSGLVYMRNRYLNPQSGQFTQEDPIGLAGGLNLYGYAGGDPVNFHDPFGLCPIRVALFGPGACMVSEIRAAWREETRPAAPNSGEIRESIADPVALVSAVGGIGRQMLVRRAATLRATSQSARALRGSNQQFGEKFGQHRDLNTPGYRSHTEYRQLANDIFNDPRATRTVIPENAPVHAGETHIRRGNDLLRLDPEGNFRSLYRVQ